MSSIHMKKDGKGMRGGTDCSHCYLCDRQGGILETACSELVREDEVDRSEGLSRVKEKMNRGVQRKIQMKSENTAM